MKNNFYIFILFLLFGLNIQLHAQTELHAQTGFSSSWNDEWVKMDNSIIDTWSCSQNLDGIKFIVIDAQTCKPWESIDSDGYGIGNSTGQYGNIHCKTYPVKAFDFLVNDNDSTQNQIANFINIIPTDHYVYVISHKNLHAEHWNDSIIEAFQSIGSSISKTNRITDTHPYILLGHKGFPLNSNESIGINSSDLITLNVTIPCTINSLSDLLSTKKIYVFPNPTKDYITISDLKNSTINLYSIHGNLIETYENTSSSTTLDLTKNDAGIYIISIQENNYKTYIKIIKQ